MKITHDDTIYLMTLVDVSRSGALINMGSFERPAWLRLEEAVELAVQPPDGSEVVGLRGTIVRILEDRRFRGFAVDFVPYGRSVRAELDSLLARAGIQQAGPPPLPR